MVYIIFKEFIAIYHIYAKNSIIIQVLNINQKVIILSSFMLLFIFSGNFSISKVSFFISSFIFSLFLKFFLKLYKTYLIFFINNINYWLCFKNIFLAII